MEDFCLRYKNVAMAGPNYSFFVSQNAKRTPIIINTRIFSCNLIRNNIPFRWRCRYNEDADLSLRILKAGYCTILFNALLQDKISTQVMKGGNTTEIYSDGTLRKSQALVDLHKDCVRLVFRYGRIHHYVNHARFSSNKLIRLDETQSYSNVNEYGMVYHPEIVKSGKLKKT